MGVVYPRRNRNAAKRHVVNQFYLEIFLLLFYFSLFVLSLRLLSGIGKY